MHGERTHTAGWARARDLALVVCAGWLVIQNLALLAVVPRATLVRVLADAAAWVTAHPWPALGLALMPVAVAAALATGVAVGALLAAPAGGHRGTEGEHV